MMMRPECYASEFKDVNYNELVLERNKLLDYISRYERDTLSNSKEITESEWMTKPGPNTVYKVYNLYLIEVTKLIYQRSNRVDLVDEGNNVIDCIEFSHNNNGPMNYNSVCSHKLKVFGDGIVEHSLYNGVDLFPVEVYNYSVDKDEMSDFFEALVNIYSIDKWDEDYEVEVCDGYSWNVKIRFTNGTTKKCIGTVEAPPRGNELENRILALVDFKVEPWIF